MTVIVEGVVYSDNVGYQKPVKIVNKGVSPVVAKKSLTISHTSLVPEPTCATASTNTTICSIKKVGNQCLSKVIEQIAWKKARQQKSLAESIGSERLARRTERTFDEKITGDRYNEKIGTVVKILGGLKFSSTCDELILGATYARPHQLAVSKDIIPPPHAGGNDLTIKVHQTLLEQIRSGKVSKGTLDRLFGAMISSLTGNEQPAVTEEEEKNQLFNLIFDAMDRAAKGGESAGPSGLTEKAFSRLQKLKFSEPDFDSESEWITIHANIQE